MSIVKSNEESNRQSAGYNGTRHLSGTNAKTCKAIGFKAWEDTVLNSVKDAGGTNQVSNMGLAGVTIPQYETFWFGFVCSEIKLTSGSGVYILAE